MADPAFFLLFLLFFLEIGRGGGGDFPGLIFR